MNKLLIVYELGRPLRCDCCLIKLYLQLICIRKNGLCAPAETRAIYNAAVGAQSIFHEQLHLLYRITLPTFMGNRIPTYSLTFPSGFKYGLYETNEIFVDTVYT